MSKGWSAFDGLPTASFLDDTSGGVGGTFTNGTSPNGVIRIPGACPPRSPASVAGPEDRFLKPIAENKHPNTIYTSPRDTPQTSPHASPNRQNNAQNQSPHAMHMQQQRPIGPTLGAFQPLGSPHQPPRQPIFLAQGDVGTNTSPVTPRQEMVYPRNDFYGSPGRSIQHSPAASNSSPANHSPGSLPAHITNSPSMQSMHAMQGMHSPFIANNEHAPVRFTPIPPHPSSPSPTQGHSAPASPFHPHNFQRRDVMVQQDEISRTADLLGAVQLDANGNQALQAQRLAMRPPGTSSPGHLGNFLGWQLPDMPPKGYKTVICKFWENNMCTKGASCTFAHGVDDLKRFAGVTGTGGCPSALKIDRYKTKLCLFHMQGRCCKGPHCPYAHGIDELRAPLPPGLLQALQAHYPNFVFGTGEVASAAIAAAAGEASEYDEQRSDQLLHSYFDEFQMHQMQSQGMGLLGPGDYQQGYDCGPDAYGDGACYADGGMDVRDTTAVPGPEYGYGGNGGYGEEDDVIELDQAQQMAAIRFFERQGQQQQQIQQAHMNSLQQQAHARVGMAQQAMRQQQNAMMMGGGGGGGMQQPGGPGGPGYPMYWGHDQQAWPAGVER